MLKWNEFDKNSHCFPQELSVVEGGDKDQAYVFAAASKKAQTHDVHDQEDNEGIGDSIQWMSQQCFIVLNQGV